jgi:hypothetical protein
MTWHSGALSAMRPGRTEGVSYHRWQDDVAVRVITDETNS